MKIHTLFQKPETHLNQTVTVSGWVRTVRDQKSFAFVELNDGSCLKNLQVIVDPSIISIETLTTGVSIKVSGLIAQSPGKNQSIELKAESIHLYGACDPTTYPLQKKRHSAEFLRTIAHLRPRTNTQGALLRIRNALSFATHEFFQKEGFLYVHTPIITASDCEGAGELFRVEGPNPKKPFFGKPAYLTVSGQLEAEILACAMGNVYTFSPTFRAENSNTSRHLAEFWMIEPELAFADLNDSIACAESYLKYCLQTVLDRCLDDLMLFDHFIDKGLLLRLQETLNTPFAKITYTEAIEHLEKAKKSFEFPISWGIDLQTEHERYLSEELFQKPVILTDYPKQIKSFYMRDNEDGKTVAAMDILVPKIGEIIGGSQREERLDILTHKIEAMGLNKEDYWWYLALREYGTIPHAGFGLGFERLLLYVTGLENIRDVIPFPRYVGHAEF